MGIIEDLYRYPKKQINRPKGLNRGKDGFCRFLLILSAALMGVSSDDRMDQHEIGRMRESSRGHMYVTLSEFSGKILWAMIAPVVLS